MTDRTMRRLQVCGSGSGVWWLLPSFLDVLLQRPASSPVALPSQRASAAKLCVRACVCVCACECVRVSV